MKLTGAEIIIKMLEKYGIEKIAGIPGGTNLPLYNALYFSKIEHILVRHEQAAGFIAQGMARSTGHTAVCFATSGPGVTNLLTAIADAKLDSVPIVAITGQVSTSLIGSDAFQEVDTYGMTIPITKHNFLVRKAEELLDVLPLAFKIASSGRPGPVVVDVPKDVQNESIEVDELPDFTTEYPDFQTPFREIEKAAEMINQSHRPVLYIGGGIVHSKAHKLLIELAKKNNIPVSATLMGLGCFPSEEPLALGMLGMHGARYTNMIVEEADLLIALGVRFDDRATGNPNKFCTNATILHIDIDKAEIDKIMKANCSIAGDIGTTLKQLIPLIKDNKRKTWMNRVEKLKNENPFYLPKSENLTNPKSLMRAIGQLIDHDTLITTDVGQHQMWAAQILPFFKPRNFLTSGGLGTMGFGLPAAIGAALANPDKKVVCISGDGSIMMNIQELATLAELGLNVKVILLNNGHLGLVRQQQEFLYNKNYIASKFIKNMNFAAIAQAFGIRAYELENDAKAAETLATALNCEGPCFINAPIDATDNVTPMVPPGKANIEMIGGLGNEFED
jgi:acetolactate synthase I/II/III large subunit